MITSFYRKRFFTKGVKVYSTRRIICLRLLYALSHLLKNETGLPLMKCREYLIKAKGDKKIALENILTDIPLPDFIYVQKV